AGCRTMTEEKTAQPTEQERQENRQRQAERKALAKRAEDAVEQTGFSLGREYANVLRDKHWQRWLKYLKGEGKKPNWPPEAKAIADIKNWTEKIEAAETWPKPGTFLIPRADKPPVIDGKIDEGEWESAYVHQEIYPFNSTEQAGPETTWRIMWDKQNLYFAFECVDVDVVSPERERDGNVFQDDCVEMFILPNRRFRTYWELVIGPDGSIFDAIHCKQLDKLGAAADVDADMQGLQTAQSVNGTLNQPDDKDQGYTVEVAVPFSDLPGYTRKPPKPGDTLHLMLVRLDKSNDEFKTYAFRPLQFWGHNIWNHATIKLVPKE
ncbi:MAG: carbohydrate-binding family 9-like protein, partial [Verrucomicrobiota bacterium]